MDISISLQKIYYQPSGYQRTALQLFKASHLVGHDFTLDEVRDWLEKQAVHQIHMPRPRYIPRASFNSITIPNELHQADVLYMPYDKVGQVTYLFCLNVVDVASRYKLSIPIDSTSVKNKQGILTSYTIARALKEKYDDSECFLSWLKVFLTDKGPEFKGECKKLMKEHGVKIQKAKSKRTMGIVERYNLTLAVKLFRIQDAHDLLLIHSSGKSYIWVKNLPIIVEDINNTITSLIGMTPAEAIKKKKIYAKPSYNYKRPIGFNEKKLSYDVLVRYLLDLSDLEGGRKRGTDSNWSSQIYHIHESTIQKNQPILYWLEDDKGDGPERSFVREELMVVKNVELPPKWVLTR